MAAQNISDPLKLIAAHMAYRYLSGWNSTVVGRPLLRVWLQNQGSLTAGLKRVYPEFSVRISKQKWTKPHADEYPLIGLARGQRAWVREVWLEGDGQPRVFAHTVIVSSALRGQWNGLRRIGKQPLGAKLFADARIKRGCLYFKKLPLSHPLYKAVCSFSSITQTPVFWARRSLFHLKKNRLLVTEVFLPSMLAV